MGSPSPGPNFALGATQVDQHAGERPWTSPDHLPSPTRWEPSRSGWWYVAVGLALACVAVFLMFFL